MKMDFLVKKIKIKIVSNKFRLVTAMHCNGPLPQVLKSQNSDEWGPKFFWVFLFIFGLFLNITVDSVITHTFRWTPEVMGFHRVWVPRELAQMVHIYTVQGLGQGPTPYAYISIKFDSNQNHSGRVFCFLILRLF